MAIFVRFLKFEAGSTGPAFFICSWLDFLNAVGARDLQLNSTTLASHDCGNRKVKPAIFGCALAGVGGGKGITQQRPLLSQCATLCKLFNRQAVVFFREL